VLERAEHATHHTRMALKYSRRFVAVYAGYAHEPIARAAFLREDLQAGAQCPRRSPNMSSCLYLTRNADFSCKTLNRSDKSEVCFAPVDAQ
jgi:hypothetical protein